MLKRILASFALVVFVVALLGVLFVYMPYVAKRDTYHRYYSDEVERYSQEFGIDKNFVYAVIKVESNFYPSAISDVGAIGLMQIIEDSFDWVAGKLGEREIMRFEDMYTPEYSIKYGCFMLSYLYNKYESYELTAAAYHSGMTTVDNWLSEGVVDATNPDVDNFIGDNTRHYVKKIMRAFEKYSNLE